MALGLLAMKSLPIMLAGLMLHTGAATTAAATAKSLPLHRRTVWPPPLPLQPPRPLLLLPLLLVQLLPLPRMSPHTYHCDHRNNDDSNTCRTPACQ